MTLKEKIIATAYTGVLFINGDELGKFYEYVDSKTDGGALDIKWASKEWTEYVRKQCKDDFLAMLKGKYSEDVDFAELYGVKPGEKDFSGAIERSLEQGPLHLSKEAVETMLGSKHKESELRNKTVGGWHLQDVDDICDAVTGWTLHKFVCQMYDGTIHEWNGINDVTCDGLVVTHLDCADEDYNDLNEIFKWTEIPRTEEFNY